MRRVLAFVALVIALFASTRTAAACENATLRDEPAYAALRDAEEELDEGDVLRARALAMPVADGRVVARFLPNETRGRAQRIVAMTWIRDRAATEEEIDRAVLTLATPASAGNPRDESALGEAYARADMTEEAYETLAPLAQRDLIGSPYAYAALARVSEKRGDHGTSVLAKKRCAEITTSAAICSGAYPSPPLLRGKTLGYALPGLLALAMLLRRWRTKRPWSAHRDKVFAAMIVLACAAVFALARSPFQATAVTALVLLVVAIGQRIAFIGAVERGAASPWVLREAAAEDAALPAVASFFHGAARVLERTPDASYREPARVPVLRLVPRRRGALGLLVVGVLVLGLFSACGVALRFSG